MMRSSNWFRFVGSSVLFSAVSLSCIHKAENTGYREGPPGLLQWETATAPETQSAPDLPALGRKVYAVRCAGCHGMEGDGRGAASVFLATPPRDFTRGVYKFRTTPQERMPADMDLFRTITAGFPAYGMPSFAYLSEKERWALVHYVKSFYPNWDKFASPEVVAVAGEPASQPDAMERGRSLYEKKFECVQCHGPKGHGDGPRAAELKDPWDRPISPRDFTLGATFRKAGWRPIDTVRILATGVPGTPMSSYIDQLPDPKNMSEFWDVARFMEHLAAEAQRDKSGERP